MFSAQKISKMFWQTTHAAEKETSSSSCRVQSQNPAKGKKFCFSLVKNDVKSRRKDNEVERLEERAANPFNFFSICSPLWIQTPGHNTQTIKNIFKVIHKGQSELEQIKTRIGQQKESSRARILLSLGRLQIFIEWIFLKLNHSYWTHVMNTEKKICFMMKLSGEFRAWCNPSRMFWWRKI